MSALTAFEVQSFRNGDWRIETITDSKDLAVHHAESIMRSPVVTKVRVVQEAFDPVSAEQKFRTVFIRHKQPRPAEVAPLPAAASKPAAEAAPPVGAMKPATAKGAGAVALTLKFGTIVVVGIAAIIALRYFANM